MLNFGKVCIVSDSNVAKIYLENLENICKEEFSTVTSFVFEAGEESKNLDTVQKLYEHLILNKFDRKSILIALGGGVVGDLTGFTAATFLRGISFIQVPTSLLSQVDSSIGGKTGVDFSQYKNMVGAFHMPKMVYINTQTLQTLPDVQFSSGMGEIIKHGLIKNNEYFAYLQENHDTILSKNAEIMEEVIYESCKIKKSVVEEDPTEKGIRAHLNFGHTIGHAIEKLSDFSLYHGQCVAIGMNAASYLSYKRGQITMEEWNKIKDVILSFNLPIAVTDYDADKILATTKLDKKMEQNKIKFITLKNVGNAMIDTEFSDDEILEAIKAVIN